ncbi:MAG: 5-formyltetrahydrofolate cyclo-ligase [Clostridium sartagoforme]|nr:5-formyltetrahydrofolate cyclo-ligase [Clostridium sartagoforme]
MNKEEKKVLRKRILEIRDSLDNKEKELMDNIIFNKLINTDLYMKANNIFIYLNFGSEVETKKIINKALEDKKEVYIPKIYKEDKSMKAIRLSSFNDLKENSMGILEPISDTDFIEKERIDLIIVPGVAFDFKGNRVGYGGGYYDRYLKAIEKNSNKLVLAYEFQIIDFIEAEAHDIKFDYIITNTKFIEANTI